MAYCPHLDWQQRLFSSDSKVCKLTNQYIPDKYFNDYCQYYNYCGNCPNYKQYGSTSNGCFITTVTCDILKKDDNCEVMNNLRKLRDDYLQVHEEYFNTLKEYDTIGPMLAERMVNDEEKEKLAKAIYSYILKPISKLVKQENYELATHRYFAMSLLVIRYYGLEDYYNELRKKDYGYSDFDPTQSGHGKTIKKNIIL